MTDSVREPRKQVGRPLFFEGTGRASGAHILVCEKEQFGALNHLSERESLYLCLGTPGEQAINLLDVCVLPEREHAHTVLNFIQRLFDRLDEWTQILKQTAQTGEDAEELLIRAADMLQNPVFLLNERGNVVAQSEKHQADLISSYNMPECNSDSAAPDGEPIARLTGSDGTGALAAKFSSLGECYTLICTASERALYGSDEVVFESLAGYVRLMLSEHRLGARAQRRSRAGEAAEQAFRSLLAQDAPERQMIDALAQIGWPESVGYCVLAAESAAGDMRTAQSGALCDLLESKFDDCCAFSLASVVVAILRSETADMLKLKRTLGDLSEQAAARFGVCEPSPGFSLLPERLSLAKVALDFAKEHGGAALFSDAAERYIAERAVSLVPAELVSLRPVLAMAEYDRAHGTSYLETAERYVKNRFNAVRTAGELFIHRSTFLYRLERIRTQFGLDLEDENVSTMHLLLSLRFARESAQ